MTSGLAVHLHHDVLVEYCTDYDERVQAIRDTKPLHEQAIRLRVFRLLSPEAVSAAPEALRKIDEAYRQAGVAHQQASEAYQQAGVALRQAHVAHQQAGVALRQAGVALRQTDEAYWQAQDAWSAAERDAWHRRWCGCAEWNGARLVFPQPERWATSQP